MPVNWFQELDLYLNNAGQNRRQHSCDHCVMEFESQESLQKHQEQHCNYCNRYFYSPKALQRHLTHMRFQPHPFYCEECDRRFRSFKSLKSHFYGADCHLHCRICQTEFRSGDDYKQHRRRDVCGRFCEFCEKAFGTKAEFEQHLDEVDAHRYCEICDKYLHSMMGLLRHHERSRYHRERAEHQQQTRPELMNGIQKPAKITGITATVRLPPTHVSRGMQTYYQTSMSGTQTTPPINTSAMGTQTEACPITDATNEIRDEDNQGIYMDQCPKCSEEFESSGSMVLHWETGICTSGINDCLVDDLARTFFQGKQYVHDEPGELWYKCPTCQEECTYISALISHAESDACEENLVCKAPLRLFLEFLRRRTLQCGGYISQSHSGLKDGRADVVT
ncbi:hypothetical protein QQS21_012653 [Conoideocrella luteorostrata]|uniref:C2H2-type domain-containing protein n=1 Tax=Conoideocrella luteorostrata TaxID=1105319 RepID=A0AAJ0CBX4_9HYPO|nr:hypothetical protein QQS21_012653 [Conoideocrella luteorostrata]